MSVAFVPGSILGRNDLNIFLHDTNGQRTNAATISYAIFDFTSGVEVLIGSSARTAENPETGEYYAAFRIPDTAPFGDYRIRWTFTQTFGGAQHQVVQEFGVVPEGTSLTQTDIIPVYAQSFLRSIRILLRDNSPDRNYHFRPPVGEDPISQQSKVFGYIWEDEELYEYLERGVDMVNLSPPQTGFTLDNIPRNWHTILLHASMIHALIALTLNWIEEDFDYSIGGISLSIDKASKYQSMLDNIQNSFEQQIERAKRTVKIVRGIQQSRYGIGIRSAFGPAVGRGVLTPRRFIGI